MLHSRPSNYRKTFFPPGLRTWFRWQSLGLISSLTSPLDGYVCGVGNVPSTFRLGFPWKGVDIPGKKCLERRTVNKEGPEAGVGNTAFFLSGSWLGPGLSSEICVSTSLSGETATYQKTRYLVTDLLTAQPRFNTAKVSRSLTLLSVVYFPSSYVQTFRKVLLKIVVWNLMCFEKLRKGLNQVQKREEQRGQ